VKPGTTVPLSEVFFGHVAGELEPVDPNLILLKVGRKALVIRRAFDDDAERAEVNRVLMSFRFAP
jgi:hypothetical protein